MAASARQYLFTSESVTEGHPDKVADQISDGVLDADLGFSADSCAVLNAVDKQSADIAQGVDEVHERRTAGSGDEFDLAGAGDQGMTGLGDFAAEEVAA